MSDDKKKRDPSSLSDLLVKRANTDLNTFVSREFQDYGYRLAAEFDDLSHKSLYIKMAKTIDRKILEAARTFVIDANARSKGRLFMWKVKQLKTTKNSKSESVMKKGE